MCIDFSLIWALQHFFQFNLDICYKSGKDNIVPNMLLQQTSANIGKLPLTHDKLNALLVIKADKWWTWVNELDDKEVLGKDIAKTFLFERDCY